MNTIVMNKLPDLDWDVEEAINQLRVNLSFAGTDTKVIFVTSTVQSEGKTFIAVNLWRSLASIDKRVLLIDSDLRLSNMRNQYGFTMHDGYAGIAHYLSGQADINEVVYGTNVRNGYIIPVTNLIANPVPLLESAKYRSMIESCRQAFDFIIIDCPPLGSVADALNISKYCDGGLLVIRSNGVSRKLIGDSVAALKRTGAPLLGVVLNRVDARAAGSYYYKSYYSYGARYYKREDQIQNRKRKAKKKK